MATIFRTPDERFAGLTGFPFEPHYAEIESGGTRLRMHYLDEGRAVRGTMLMVHGMPTWSYLYRRMIPPLVAEGYRCIVPDHIGFGRSDKVLEDDWYTIGRHTENLTQFIEQLDLRGVTLVCQDWGGPTGLHQAAAMPERFERLCVMNTWLHHAGHAYTDGIKRWYSLWQPGGPMETIQGCGWVMQRFVLGFPHGRGTPLTGEEAFAAYEAPFPDNAAKAGPRRFPKSIPIYDETVGNAAVQAEDFETLKQWRKPVHFIWGTKDDVFPTEWGREWASTFRGASFDTVEAGHFLQESHGDEVAEILLARIAEE